MVAPMFIYAGTYILTELGKSVLQSLIETGTEITISAIQQKFQDLGIDDDTFLGKFLENTAMNLSSSITANVSKISNYAENKLVEPVEDLARQRQQQLTTALRNGSTGLWGRVSGGQRVQRINQEIQNTDLQRNNLLNTHFNRRNTAFNRAGNYISGTGNLQNGYNTVNLSDNTLNNGTSLTSDVNKLINMSRLG